MQTERLILRRYCPSDLENLFSILSDPKVVRFEPYKPMSMAEVQENLAWRISTDEMIAIELKENHQMIGNVYLGKRDYATLEIGYVLNRDYWGQGFAVEACEALLQKAFEQGIHRIYAECDPENTASWRLLERLGFRREAHLRQNIYFWQDEKGQPIWKDTFVYAKLRSDQQSVS